MVFARNRLTTFSLLICTLFLFQNLMAGRFGRFLCWCGNAAQVVPVDVEVSPSAMRDDGSRSGRRESSRITLVKSNLDAVVRACEAEGCSSAECEKGCVHARVVVRGILKSGLQLNNMPSLRRYFLKKYKLSNVVSCDERCSVTASSIDDDRDESDFIEDAPDVADESPRNDAQQGAAQGRHRAGEILVDLGFSAGDAHGPE